MGYNIFEDVNNQVAESIVMSTASQGYGNQCNNSMQFNGKSNNYNWDQNAYNPAGAYGEVCYEVPSFCCSNQTAEMMNITSIASHTDKNHLNDMFCENSNFLYENTQNAILFDCCT